EDQMRRSSKRRACKPLSRCAKALFFASAVLGSRTSWATALWWDSDGVTVGGATNGVNGSNGSTAPGTWGTSVVWNSDSSGRNGGVLTSTTTTADNVAFSAGNDVTGSYVVTLSGTQAAGSVTFEEGAVTLASGTLNLAAGTINNTVSAAINAVVAGNSGLN